MTENQSTNQPEQATSNGGTGKESTPVPVAPARRGLLGMLRHHVLLPVVATCNVPHYALFMWVVPYNAVLWTTKNNYLRAGMLAYWGYCIMNKAHQAPKKSKFIRWFQKNIGNRLPFLRMTAEYFPVSLIKTVELPPEKPYLFSYHPHGVIGMGVLSALAADGCDFPKKFPGVDRSCVTLNMNFAAPIYRHWMLWMGCIGANKQTLVGRLGNGESLLLLPGGAAEALYAHPHSMKLYIQHRKGFVKLAMETKTGLVPVFGFGENDAFDTAYTAEDSADSEKNSWSLRHMVWTAQKRLYKLNSYSIPLVSHIIPRRRPIDVVVGSPIHFPEDMSLEEGHKLYLDALQKLYDEHKHRHGYEDVKLEFL